jgi:hypothetical protein
MEGRVPHLLAAALRPVSTSLTSRTTPATRKEAQPGAVGAGAYPGTPGHDRATVPGKQTDNRSETGHQHNQ